jgi:hypothetical protein
MMDQDEGLLSLTAFPTNFLAMRDRIFLLDACLELALLLPLLHKSLPLVLDSQHLLVRLQSHGKILICKYRSHRPHPVQPSHLKDLLQLLELYPPFHQQHPRQTAFLTDLNFRMKH